jgi:hypothetical protein
MARNFWPGAYPPMQSLSAAQAERLLQFVLECETLAEVAQSLRDA